MAFSKSEPYGRSSVEEILNEARNGRMFILVDDEHSQSKADLVVPAQMATPAAVNFMAKHGRGLICLALTKQRVEQLGLPLMSRRSISPSGTAFTVSIEAREGVSTGISAADRARTISVAIDAANTPNSIVSPGHVFPLMARDGGVLVRAGHTEAAVDIARLAGLNPSGVICPILDLDGKMACLADISRLAELHEMKIGNIRDLIAYRRRFDNLVECTADEAFVSEYGGDWRMLTYRSIVDNSRNYALVKGKIDSASPLLVRVHVASIFSDMLGQPGPRKRLLQRSMMEVGKEGKGVVLLLVPESETASDVPSSRDRDMDLRTYGIGAQILADLGVHDMILLTNSPHRAIVGVEAFGLNVVGERPFQEASTGLQ
ncbi:3,4-dihydroxy-2-butanone-4-phosphate synthase [Aquisediminimonas profunda]|uniref:3,4-dihydroxy-2-butanone-4-phosphate synthase n=1 Tax=Aquisediminimonas profunda TaxID=1550733 RepID=UPI001C62AD0F|nr:3,4-dihydroxy-2-butanone-4-phosphate synthase [Aquisediminimonas profunda]